MTVLSGVLAFTGGAGQYRGLLINAPLTTANSTVVGAAPAKSVTSGLGGVTALGVGQALLFAFIGGLILNLMPCVLPILSMKVYPCKSHDLICPCCRISCMTGFLPCGIRDVHMSAIAMNHSSPDGKA